ncbi:MAG: hypothetical protein AAGA48_21940 [Myxococcota bacterium]
MRRLPQMLAMTALLTGCSIGFDFDSSGTIPFALGDLGPDCSQKENPSTYETEDGGVCTVEYQVDGDTCRILADCSDFQLIDTEDVSNEIDDATGGNNRIRTRLTGLDLVVTNFGVSSGPTPNLTDVSISISTAKEGASTVDVVSMNLDDYNQLLSTGQTTVFDGPDTDSDYNEDDYPFIAQVNTCVEDGTPLPVVGSLVIEMPLSEVAAIAGTNVQGSFDYDAMIRGRGSIRLIGGGN